MSRSFFSLRRGLAASGVVLVLGSSAIGIASAQTAPAATPTSAQAGPASFQAFVDALAKRLGISSATLQTAIGQARTDAGLPATGGFGPGGGRHGPGGPGGGQELSAAATVIGIPVTQLQTELATKSLADVATAHGKAPADVATALKNAAHTRIDQAVTAGRITAAEAATQKTQVDQRIDQQMTQVRPAGAAGPGGPGGFGRNLDAAATAIGIPVTQLRTELSGKTLAAVATAHGKAPADVATALKNAAHTRVDQAVTDGRITAAEAATQKTQVDQRIDQQMTEVAPQAPAGT